MKLLPRTRDGRIDHPTIAAFLERVTTSVVYGLAAVGLCYLLGVYA